MGCGACRKNNKDSDSEMIDGNLPNEIEKEKVITETINTEAVNLNQSRSYKIFDFFNNLRKNPINYIEESKKYNSKSEFGKNKSGAYHFALKNDLLKEMIWLKRPKRYDIIKWNYETVIDESKKYTSRSEFAKKCDGAYKYALKNDLLDDMVWLKSKELFGENGQKIDNVYAYEFIKYKVVYVGRTIDTERRDKQHRKHLSDNNKSIDNFNKLNINSFNNNNFNKCFNNMSNNNFITNMEIQNNINKSITTFE